MNKLTENDRKLFTILIASFNRLLLLQKAIESALKQEFEDYEVLVIDDGSNQETIDWLKSIESDKLVVFYQVNSGVAMARQVGLKMAKGSYICILDSDDFLFPYSLANLEAMIKQNSQTDLFYCNNIEKYPKGKKRKSNYPTFRSSREFINAIMTYPRIPFKHSGTTFKRSKALEIGGYDSSLQSKIDIDFVIKFLKNSSEFFLIEKPLVEFFFHKNSISRKKRIKDLRLWWEIINKYGPKNRFKSFLFKSLRTLFESLKFVYEKFKV